MLVACKRCHRQYDVGHQAPGERVRCLCGEVATVPDARPRRVEMLHCSNCGGRLAAGGGACPYCAAVPKLADLGLGPACPECLATTFAGAKHCSACGVRLAPEPVTRALSDRSCPRCSKRLTAVETGKVRYVECAGCAGLWLDEALFERVASERDAAEGSLAAVLRGQASVGEVRLESQVRYLPCPVCGELMNRRNFAGCSGVVLDQCRGHGWWFDAHELGRVLDFVAAGGLEKARALRVEEHELRVERLRREERRLREVGSAPLPPPARGVGTPFEDLVGWLLGRLLSL